MLKKRTLWLPRSHENPERLGRFFEIARVFVRFNRVASCIVNGWQAYESPGVQPVFMSQEQAIDYAKGRACFRSGEIRLLDSSGAVTRIIAFVRVRQPFKSPFSSKALYIPLNPVARLDELVVAGRKARAAKRGAVRAKGRSGNHRHLLRVSRPRAKSFSLMPVISIDGNA